MIEHECKICGKHFLIKPSHAARGWGKYCSQACRHLGQRKGKYVACHWCSAMIWRMPKDLERSVSGYYFCNRKCSMAWKNSVLRSGSNHSFWQGGESTYRIRMKNKDPNALCSACGITDQRVLAVHHRDRNRKNNNFSNLIWLCHNCHYLEHHQDT